MRWMMLSLLAAGCSPPPPFTPPPPLTELKVAKVCAGDVTVEVDEVVPVTGIKEGYAGGVPIAYLVLEDGRKADVIKEDQVEIAGVGQVFLQKGWTKRMQEKVGKPLYQH